MSLHQLKRSGCCDQLAEWKSCSFHAITSLPVIQACCFLKTHVFSSLQIEKAEGESSQAKERERALTRGTVRVPQLAAAMCLGTRYPVGGLSAAGPKEDAQP